MKKYIFIPILIQTMAWSQVGPPIDIHSNPPRSWALINATIHTAPGKIVENGTIIIRDGLIKSVGARVKIPNQASIIDLKGNHAYPGFIESWVDVKTVKKDTSAEAHWNSNMRAHLQASSLFNLNEKTLEEMRKLGFTTAHIAPSGGIFQGTSAIVQIGNEPKILEKNISQVIHK